MELDIGITNKVFHTLCIIAYNVACQHVRNMERAHLCVTYVILNVNQSNVLLYIQGEKAQRVDSFMLKAR